MGFELKNPLIASSSGMTDSLEKIKELHKAGIGAVVLKSIFEEQILREIDALGVNNMYDSYKAIEDQLAFYTKEHNLNNYLSLIQEAKQAVDIPVIASISCLSDNEWVNYALKIEEAGADGIELNMFILPSDATKTGAEIEAVYFKIIKHIKNKINIPIALKLSSYFSGMANVMVQLSQTGIASMVLFNRFYTPDINLEKEELISTNLYSVPEENGNTLRWVSILSGQVACDMASSTGVHDGAALIKNLLAGAKAVQIASVLYKKKLSVINEMLKELENWMLLKNYRSLDEVIGKMNVSNMKKPMVYERAQFMKYYSNHY
jgi:dihydroorotate dehydrogenase (fumarate)